MKILVCILQFAPDDARGEGAARLPDAVAVAPVPEPTPTPSAAHAVAMSDSPAEVTDACEATTVSVARLIDRVLAADGGRSR